MERLLEAVTAVVCLVSPEKVLALAGRIRPGVDGLYEESLGSMMSVGL